MRSTLRSLTFGLAATLAGALSAQYPYGLIVQGSIIGCYPGQTVNVQTVQGTEPAYNFDVPVDPNTCSFSAALGLNTSMSWVQVSTQCSGQVITLSDSVVFNFFGDSAFVQFSMVCGGGALDCNGVENGPDMPGTPCDDGNPMTSFDTWTPACVCAGQDSSQTTDCLGVVGGSALPGSPCTDFFGNPGTWSPACVCETNQNPVDCEGNPGGGAWPGTACVYTPDSGNTYITGIWSADCVCMGDSANYYDCLQIPNGPNVPGSPCQAFGMTGTWNSACECITNNPDPCNADFWVLQAMGPDSLPVPYTLWVWNLSTGNVVYTWDFGDGTTSTDPYPTHTYSGNGPYNLCLSITDNNGCTDTHCDSISINADGVYEGMVVHGEDRQDGFTINVMAPLSNGITTPIVGGDIATWPNPVSTQLNVAFVSGLKGLATVTITDLDGRLVSSSRQQLVAGRNRLQLSTEELRPGLYTVRIAQGAASSSVRFVKVD